MFIWRRKVSIIFLLMVILFIFSNPSLMLSYYQTRLINTQITEDINSKQEYHSIKTNSASSSFNCNNDTRLKLKDNTNQPLTQLKSERGYNYKNTAENTINYKQHSRINIDGTAAFHTRAASEGWSGNGTADFPYIISGFNITSVNFFPPIYIRNVDIYFQIIDCWIAGGSVDVVFESVTHGSIINNTLKNAIINTIKLVNSSDVTIHDNIIFDSYQAGILLSSSPNNVISHNIFNFHDKHAISLEYSQNNTIVNNQLINTGLKIRGGELADYIQYNITGNVINNKELIYWQSRVNSTMETEAGQIILLNCSNILIMNQNLSRSSNGLQAIYCNNLNITQNSVNLNSNYGISFVECTNNMIKTNNFESNKILAIHLDNSANNSISQNSLHNSSSIYLSSSPDNTLSANICNGTGISLVNSYYNKIIQNTIFNAYNGINLAQSSFNSLINNSITNIAEHGILLANSPSNNISSNLFNRAGLMLEANSIEDYIQQEVSNNTVNTRPLIFLQNKINTTVDSSSGQIVMINTSSSIIENQVITNTSIGLILAHCTDIEVRNTTANYNKDGMLLEYSSNCRIEDNVFSFNRETAITNQDSNNNLISSNTFFNNSLTGILHLFSYNNNISFNIFTSNNEGIRMFDSFNNTILNNIYYSNHHYGVAFFFRCTNNMIAKNRIEASKNGIYLSSSPSNSMVANTFIQTGLVIKGSLDDCTQLAIENNTVNGKPLIYWLQRSNEELITPIGQLIIIDCANIQVKNQSFLNCSIGIIAAFCDQILIENCHFGHNRESGIYLANSRNIEIDQNNISDTTKYGLYLVASANNSITYNNFIQNNKHGASQAFDDYRYGTRNIFSHNYWSDWNNPDNDNNGIVDIPYNITGNAMNQDLHPLAKLYSPTSFHVLSSFRIVYPTKATTLNGTVTIQWTESIDSLGHAVNYTILISSNTGQDWSVLSNSISSTTYQWDTTAHPNGNNYLLRIEATCSANITKTITIEDVFSIQNEKNIINISFMEIFLIIILMLEIGVIMLIVQRIRDGNQKFTKNVDRKESMSPQI